MFRAVKFAVLLVLLAAIQLSGQTQTPVFGGSGGGGASFTGVVGSLPATCTEGAIAIVTDADALDDCSTGSSTLENVCLCDDSNTWLDEDIGGSTGDTITVNGAAAADADFDDADPAAPANATNVTWQLNTATTPDSISAYVNWVLVESITRGGGGSASFTTTYSVSGTDTVVTHGNNVFNISTGLLQEGGNEVPNDTDHLGFFAATTSAQLAGVLSNESGTGLFILQTSPTIVTPTIASFTNAAHDHSDAAGGAQFGIASHSASSSADLLGVLNDEVGSGLFVLDTTPTIATPILTGKIDRNNVAVDDDDCTGEQGNWWYDTTDSAFEFCDANSGAPAVLGGGGAEINDLEATDPPNVEANEVYVGTGPGAGAHTAAPVLGTSVQAPLIVSSQAVDGSAVGLEIRNTQAHAAASTNETADIDFYFNTDLVAKISIIKEDDYDPGPGEDDAAMVFSVDRDGTPTEGFRVRSTGGIQLDIGAARGIGTGLCFSDCDTEIYESVDDRLVFRLGGSTFATLQSNGQFVGSNGNAGSPTWTFASDSDIGMYRSGTNQIGFTINGSKFFELGGSQTALFEDTTPTTGDTLVNIVPGAGEAGDILVVDTDVLVVDALLDRVGMGTAIPATAAHVVRGLEGSVPGSLDSSTLTVQHNEFVASDALITLLAGTSGESILEFADSGDRNIGFISYDHLTNSMQFGTNAIGNRIFIDSAGNVGIGKGTKHDGYVIQDSSEVQTTDATVTVLDTLTLLDENTYHVEAIVVGVKSDGTDRASYHLAATVYRTGAGSATLQGGVTSLHTQESNASWDANFTVSGNDVRVSVTGVAATTVEWGTTLKFINMSN